MRLVTLVLVMPLLIHTEFALAAKVATHRFDGAGRSPSYDDTRAWLNAVPALASAAADHGRLWATSIRADSTSEVGNLADTPAPGHSADAHHAEGPSGPNAGDSDDKRLDSVEGRAFGMRCDFRTVRHLSFEAGGRTVSTDDPDGFTSADVGAIVFGRHESAAQGGNAPLIYRTIVAVDQRGRATLSSRGGGFTANSGPTSSLDVGHDDAPSFIEAWKKVMTRRQGGIIDLPSGNCLMMSATSVTAQVHVGLQGQGPDTTRLIYADDGDGLRVTSTNQSSLTARDFTVYKYMNANGGAPFKGVGFYFGNTISNAPSVEARAGRLFIENVNSFSNYDGDGWNRNFEFENITNVHADRLMAVGTTRQTISEADIVFPGSTSTDWGKTASNGAGASFYIHGDNGGYALDSTYDDLVSIANNVSIDAANYQGLYITNSHLINAVYGFREMPGYNNDTDESLILTGNLIQALNGDVFTNQSTQTSIVGNTIWGYGAKSQRSWFGVFADGALNQAYNITGNNFAVYPDTGFPIYDCISKFPHTITGNSVDGNGPITTCPSASEGVISANSGPSVQNLGHEMIIGNAGGTVSDDGHGGVNVGNGVDLGRAGDPWGGWKGRVYGYVGPEQTRMLTPSGDLPAPTHVRLADGADAEVGATSIRVQPRQGALIAGGNREEIVDTTQTPPIEAVITSTAGDVLRLSRPLSRAMRSGDTLILTPAPGARVGSTRGSNNGLLTVKDLYCYSSGTPGTSRFTISLTGQYAFYAVRDEKLTVDLSSSLAHAKYVLPSGYSVRLGRGEQFGEPTIMLSNSTSVGLYCSSDDVGYASGP